MNSGDKLNQKKCKPCSEETAPLKGEELRNFQSKLDKNWSIVDDHQLEREYTFPNFREALAFTNKIGALAEEEDHHPDIFLSYGKVKVVLSTHHIDGLSANDFILAAKISDL